MADDTTHQVLRAPSARVFTRWTPALIEAARRSAESGDMSRAVQICDWLLTDDAVRAALGARVDAVLGLDVDFQPAVEGVDADNDPQIAALRDDWDTCYPEQETSQILTWGLLLGVAPARHEVRTVNGRLLPCPRLWHPGTLTHDPRTGIWKVRDIDGQEHVVDPGLTGEWLLHRPFGEKRPWALGLWQTLVSLVMLKSFAREDWSRSSERSTLLVGEVVLDKDGNLPTGKIARADFVQQLAGRGADAVVGLPPGWTLKLLQVADNYQIYLEQVSQLNDAIATVIRGGNLTTQTSGGSKAAADTQAKMGDAPKLKTDTAVLSTFYRTQSISWWATWNFGDADKAPWPSWSTPASAPEVNYFSFANGLSTLADMGFTLDLETLRKEFGLNFVTAYDPAKAKPKATTFGAPADAPPAEAPPAEPTKEPVKP